MERIRIIVVMLSMLLFMSAGVQVIAPLPEKIYGEFRRYDFMSNDAELRFRAFRVEYLHTLKEEKLEKYTSLEYAFILIEAPPMAADREKEKMLKLFDKNIHYLKEFEKCPSLKGLVFKIDSYILIRSSDKGLSYKNSTRAGSRKAYALNLRRFDERFGIKLKKLLPGIKLYSRNNFW